MKICPTCKIEKPYTEFCKRKSSKDGYNYQCKSCVKEYQVKNIDKISQQQKQYRIDNADKIMQRDKNYRQSPQGKLVYKTHKHKRRALIKANTLVGKDWKPHDIILKLKLQYNKCIYCEISIKDSYHIDHIIPPCDGGGNEAWNIQLLCRKCNRAKWDNPAHEYAQKYGKLI